jgi:ABC-type transport system involved in multi-copper enzyme maturation permease subunit
MCIANIVDSIIIEEKKYEETHSYNNGSKRQNHYNYEPKRLLKLPYYFYSPLAWIFTSIISLFGDSILLAFTVRSYQISIPDDCTNLRIGHIVYDSVALFISVISVLWFIIFGFYVISHKHRHHHHHTSRY